MFYLKKEDAGQAMQKLYYVPELGDNMSIEYYKKKEARIIEQDRLNDPFR